MEAFAPYALGALLAAAILFGLLAWGKSRRKAETLTIEALIAAASAADVAKAKALDDADRLAAEIGRDLAQGQQALADNLARIAAARVRLAGNAAPTA